MAESQKNAHPFFGNKRIKYTTKTAIERDGIAKRRQERMQKQARAVELFEQGIKKIRIAEQLGVTYKTLCLWLKDVPKPSAEKVAEMEPFNKKLHEATDEVVEGSLLAARDEEQQALLEVAENQSSPADKYQAYVAASAIKMLRDNLMNVRGPRTVRELSELDQLIRRNLGLNPKGGSGSGGGLTIDISILNNPKAALGGSAVVVDVEEADDE